MWDLHDRLESLVNEDTCRSEIDSFVRHGQLVPALARRLHGDPQHDLELIYGARRLFVARHVNRPLLVEVRAVSDREGIIAMDIENRHRKDISPYERGMSYARWLAGGYFASQEEVARVLRVSPPQVSRLLKLARLPSVIVSAFVDPREICEAWVLDLMAALEDPERRPAIMARACALGSQVARMPAREVFRQLLGAAPRRRKASSGARDEVVTGEDGTPLFRIKFLRDSISMELPIHAVSARSLRRIRRALEDLLQPESSQADDLTKDISRMGRPAAVHAVQFDEG
jgi:ParB family chromosome partitioning protein